MATERILRPLTASLIAAAVLVGLASRVASWSSDHASAGFAGVGAMVLRPSERIGGLVFERVDEAGALRLGAPDCGRPVFAYPMLLTSVTITQVADSLYLRTAYRSLDVYRGAVRARFSRFERLLAHVAAGNASANRGYFVRFYAPTECLLPDEAYSTASQAILALGAADARRP